MHYCANAHLHPGEIPKKPMGASTHRANSGSFLTASVPVLEMGQTDKMEAKKPPWVNTL